MAVKLRAVVNFIDASLVRIFGALQWMGRVLPARVMIVLYNVGGDLLYAARPTMRRNLLAKLAAAMPEMAGDRRLRRIARMGCRAIVRPTLDLILYDNYGDRIRKDLEVTGEDYLRQAEAQGDGVLLTTIHLGGFAIISSLLANRGTPATMLVYDPKDIPVTRYVNAMYELAMRLGCDPDDPMIFTGDDTVTRVNDLLARGKRPLIPVDVDGGTVVDFFGRPAALASGVAYFALESGAPIVPVILRRKPGLLQMELRFYPPVVPATREEYAAAPERQVQELVQRMARLCEEIVRETPEQWMSWFGLFHWWELADELLAKRTGSSEGSAISSDERGDDKAGGV